MQMQKLIVGALSLSAAHGAVAGSVSVPLGTSLGSALGVAMGSVLGMNLGTALPIAGSGLLLIAAVSLVVGIRIVRRKQNR